jgi:hypothetical protein
MGGKTNPKKIPKMFCRIGFREFISAPDANHIRRRQRSCVYTPLRTAALRASWAYRRSCKKLNSPKTEAMQTTNETHRTLRTFFGKRRENANDHNDWLRSLPLPFGNSLWVVKTAVLIRQRFCLTLDLPTIEVVGGCGGWTTTLYYYRFTYPLISGVGSRVMAKEILSHPLSPLFSPLIPSFSGICKVRKFY